MVDLEIEKTDLEKDYLRIREGNSEVDFQFDALLDRVDEKEDFYEIIRTLIYLSQYIDTKMNRLVTVENPKVIRDKFAFFNSQKVSNIESVLDKERLKIEYKSDSFGKYVRFMNSPEGKDCGMYLAVKGNPRSLRVATEITNLLIASSNMRELISLFYQNFPNGTDNLVSKIMEQYKFLSDTETLLKSRLDEQVASFKRKSEIYSSLEKTLEERKGLESHYSNYGKRQLNLSQRNRLFIHQKVRPDSE